MKTSKDYLRSSMDRVHLQQEVYRLYRLENLPLKDVMKKTGLGHGTVYQYLRTFEAENPELVAQMKKRKDVTPDDYKKLQAEIARHRPKQPLLSLRTSTTARSLKTKSF